MVRIVISSVRCIVEDVGNVTLEWMRSGKRILVCCWPSAVGQCGIISLAGSARSELTCMCLSVLKLSTLLCFVYIRVSYTTIHQNNRTSVIHFGKWKYTLRRAQHRLGVDSLCSSMCVITQILTSVRQTTEVVALKPRALTLLAAFPVPVGMATKETALPAQVILSLKLSSLHVPQLLTMTLSQFCLWSLSPSVHPFVVYVFLTWL